MEFSCAINIPHSSQITTKFLSNKLIPNKVMTNSEP